MPRKPTVWFREQDGWFYTTLRRKQVKLAQDEAEAERAFHALLARAEPEEKPQGYRPSFKKLAVAFLKNAEKTVSPGAFTQYRWALQSFCDHVKGKKAADLKKADVTDWINAREDWGHNSRVLARSVLRTCLRWAAEEGHLAANPLPGLKTGSYRRRERVLSPAERAMLKETVRRKNFKDYLTFLELTGARPFTEAAAVTAAMVDFAGGTIAFERHKNAGKGKTRTIYLTPPLEVLLRKLCLKSPAGPLFHTHAGNPYSRQLANNVLRRACDRAGIPRATAYSYRHGYITEALEKGVPVEVVAELVGSSPQTIHRFYCHLSKKKETLKEMARRAVG